MKQRSRAHLYISGRVQGVYYRAFVRNTVASLGLFGWVRNLYDGRVEALFEGDKGKIEQAIKDCYMGPSGARVDNVEVMWEDYKGDLKVFEILY